MGRRFFSGRSLARARGGLGCLAVKPQGVRGYLMDLAWPPWGWSPAFIVVPLGRGLVPRRLAAPALPMHGRRGPEPRQAPS